ncbi:NRT1/ PTR FAMILY 8.1 [Thalictrum thalictroides]|uniref:NRT1/ PTR FAMILY 8.1 n=1 Tax=Thalictrum thalictroides TaxID=46969 RepID=A0A7J6XD43_THATH|nr:NRT1/ PTR FAMILY 8.1 [Thalictrum thalictroides]
MRKVRDLLAVLQKEDVQQSTTLVSNGCVDFRGNIADKRKTGGWNASLFVIVNEVAERLAFYAISINMVRYLIIEMHQSLPDAAAHINNWIGAAFVLTLLGAFVADAYLGRFKTMITYSCVYAVGMVLLTLSAAIDDLRPPPCIGHVCKPATGKQTAFLYFALGLIAFGTGGIKPCVSTFGADQFDIADEKELQKKSSFFNWFFFAISMGAILGVTVVIYIQTEHGWVWGFSIPTAAMMISIFVLVGGIRYYRYQKPTGSPFTRFAQVVVASIRNHKKGVQLKPSIQLYEVNTQASDIIGASKLPHSAQYRFLDKAAVITDHETSTTNRWRLCTVTQVEEFKSFIRILPIWASTMVMFINLAQTSTFFINQATIMNRELGHSFVIPAGSVSLFAAVSVLTLVPIYEGLAVPILRHYTGHKRGITSLQRIGVGLFISIFALGSAAVVEKDRRDNYPKPNSMSVFWLVPQFFLVGSGEVFTYVGLMEFFYDEASDGIRSISSAMFLTEIGMGSWLSSALVKIVGSATGGIDEGWLRNTLNTSQLDKFYWLIAGINVVNFSVFLFVSWRYKGRDRVGISRVRDETIAEVQDKSMVA